MVDDETMTMVLDNGVINDDRREGETARDCAVRHLVASLREKPIPKLTTDDEVNKELLARFPFGIRKDTMYAAWRWAIGFHRAERAKLAHFEARDYA